jgi:hypothetical protein
MRENKYKWKQIPPRDGETTIKKVLIDGVKKKYYWCVHHKMWTLHSPQECRKADDNRKKRKAPASMKAHQRERSFMRKQGWLLRHWLCWPATPILQMVVQTMLKIPIRIAISQKAAAQTQQLRATKLLSMRLMSPDYQGPRENDAYPLMQPTSSYCYMV